MYNFPLEGTVHQGFAFFLCVYVSHILEHSASLLYVNLFFYIMWVSLYVSKRAENIE